MIEGVQRSTTQVGDEEFEIIEIPQPNGLLYRSKRRIPSGVFPPAFVDERPELHRLTPLEERRAARK